MVPLLLQRLLIVTIINLDELLFEVDWPVGNGDSQLRICCTLFCSLQILETFRGRHTFRGLHTEKLGGAQASIRSA
jgi:hypothetical protein